MTADAGEKYTVTIIPDTGEGMDFPLTLHGLTGAISRAMTSSAGGLPQVIIKHSQDGSMRVIKRFEKGKEADMAKELQAYDFTRRSNRKYDWDRLLDGKIWECRRGVDFDRDLGGKLTVNNFRSAACNAARRRGLMLETQAKDKDTLVIRVTGERNW